MFLFSIGSRLRRFRFISRFRFTEIKVCLYFKVNRD